MKDKKTVRAWIDEEFARAAPTAVVPAHGAPVSRGDVVATTRSLLAAM